MNYTVQHNCQQCGASIEFHESDRLVRCQFCGVKSFLISDHYQFLLPPRYGQEHLLVPYLRFRGVEYVCDLHGVHHRVVDVSQCGLPLDALPESLGLRPQAMKLQFAHRKAGQFLTNYLQLSDALLRAEKTVQEIRPRDILHRAYIGETISRIYLPLYRKEGRLYDGVSDICLGKLPRDRDIFEPAYDTNAQWNPKFLSATCPQCGWDLSGEADSIALGCHNCETLWTHCRKGMELLDCSVLANGNADRLYLPFWRMEVQLEGVEINSFADLIRSTNQPMVIRKEWESQKFYFWTPAFKVRPKTFLRLSRQMTLQQKKMEYGEGVPKKSYPVTLSVKEAAESVAVILADMAKNKKSFVPHLVDLKCRKRKSKLLFLPFKQSSSDLIQEQFGVYLNSRVLSYGRAL